MDFKDVKQALREIQLDALRQDSDTHFEAVLLRNEIEKLMDRLEGFFGVPVFPAKGKLPKHIERGIAPFGGIMSGQTLYYMKQKKGDMFAMLWPWNDGQKITLKVISK